MFQDGGLRVDRHNAWFSYEQYGVQRAPHNEPPPTQETSAAEPLRRNHSMAERQTGRKLL